MKQPYPTSYFLIYVRNIVLAAVMVLQSITGILPSPSFAEKGDASKKIRKGMPLGAKVELFGQDMFLFLDKMTQCVLPRIPEYKGIETVWDDPSSISFKLPSQSLGYFPDIEPHFDMFPRLVDMTVEFETSCQDSNESKLLISAFQIPIVEYLKKGEVVVEVDKYAELKLAKTREERKAIASAMGKGIKKEKEKVINKEKVNDKKK
jgi:ribosomal protein L5